MGKSSGNDGELSCQKYGVPLYGAAWVPPAAASTGKEDGAAQLEFSVKRHVLLAGGGGDGRSGIPNALLLSTFDFESNSLLDQPVAKLGTGSDLPYRIAVHPGGEGVICSLPEIPGFQFLVVGTDHKLNALSCQWENSTYLLNGTYRSESPVLALCLLNIWFEWDIPTSTDKDSFRLRSSNKVLEQLEDVGEQLAMTFNNEGNLLAVGGKDGSKLRVFKWPAMETTLDEVNALASVKDIDFSSDGKFLVSVGSGPGRIWNVTKSTPIASLPKENDEVFGFCRFSRTTDTDLVLYVIAMQDKGSSIVKWNTSSWKRISSTHVVRDPVSAFNVSPDGKHLVLGTIQGDILIISSASMQVQTVVRKAHLGPVTALAFSQDSRALVSASFDSSARVTLIKDEKKDGTSSWIIWLIILLAVVAYYAKSKGVFL